MRKYSSKGFIALDLDGTVLVQKIDKQIMYGLTYRRSDIRVSLLEFSHMAQQAGYDLVIITARHSWIEKLLLEPGRNILGTKPTCDIITELKQKGIDIKEMIRVAPKNFKEGLKGEAMASLLKQYKVSGAVDAKGILFDDQLKQIKDVKKLGNKNLIAYDINSFKDRKKFIETIDGMLLDEMLSKHVFPPTLLELSHKINSIAADIYPQEIRVLNKIVYDLMLRRQEAEAFFYQPEIDWVTNATDGINLLTDKLLESSPKVITHQLIAQISKKIFDHANPATFTPNTKCERTITGLLTYMTRLQPLYDIKSTCKNYQLHLQNVVSREALKPETTASKNAKEKLALINNLIEVIDRNKNPTTALKLFYKNFSDKEALLRRSRLGNQFINRIYSFLAQIPFLGYLFKTQGARVVDAINHAHNTYSFYTTKHYQKEEKPGPDESAILSNLV